jgi:putative ABC transport system substrate-binding protein
LGAAVRRRQFISLLGSAAIAWPRSARAQKTVPVIGFLRSTTEAGSAHLVAALKKGLAAAGFRDGEGVAFEYRFANNNHERLPALARELIDRRVAAIVGNTEAAKAAKAASATVPVVFVTGSDPIRHGLIVSFNRPGGNVTGIIFNTSGVSAKRLALLHQLVPSATVIAAILDPRGPSNPETLQGLEDAGRAIGRRIVIVRPKTVHEIEPAFAKIAQDGARALFVGPGPLFLSGRRQLIDLAARHALPASYATRQYADAGGLMSYGTSQTDAYREAGTYVGRILKGDKPAELPVVQNSKFELVINLATAKRLGLAIPPTLLAITDEAIE